MNRFDYVRYTKENENLQLDFKEKMKILEYLIETKLPKGRSSALALTKLEEVYMWIGKAIRDGQSDAPLLEERKSDGEDKSCEVDVIPIKEE